MPIHPELRSRYPKDWKARSRFVRFYRAKNRCEWCAAENYQPHPVTGSRVVLTVAHVYDRRPEASDLLNLAALCQRCHNLHDLQERVANRRERARGPQLALPGLDHCQTCGWARPELGCRCMPLRPHGRPDKKDAGQHLLSKSKSGRGWEAAP